MFNKPNIYVEHIKQGFILPCFCIKFIKTEEIALISNRYKLFNKIEITYFDNKNDNSHCNEILRLLYDNFNMLKFENGFIKGENMQGIIENDIVKFIVEYNFYIFKKFETEKMQKLYL